ncbi:MAG: sigma factor-like helix-turn-helix DNA-binding protein [Candidatus Latescibacterota bacterium]
MYRRVLVAYYIRQASCAQIAAALGVPPSTVKWRLHEGRKRLRERWDRLMDEPRRIYDRIEWWIG